MDTAEAASAKASIGAAVKKSPTIKARTSASKAAEVESTTAEPAAMESPKSAAAEPTEATSVETSKSAVKGRGMFGTNHETHGQSGTYYQHHGLRLPA